MGVYSEKTQRELDKYFRNLVRRTPPWLRLLFEDSSIAIDIDPTGTIALAFDESLDDRTRQNAASFIARYMDRYPSRVFEEKNIV